jgi:hypothetical protein
MERSWRFKKYFAEWVLDHVCCSIVHSTDHSTNKSQVTTTGNAAGTLNLCRCFVREMNKHALAVSMYSLVSRGVTYCASHRIESRECFNLGTGYCNVCTGYFNMCTGNFNIAYLRPYRIF